MINDATLDELWQAFEEKPEITLLRVIADRYQEVAYELETFAEGIRWLADFERIPKLEQIEADYKQFVVLWKWNFSEIYIKNENIPLQGVDKSPFSHPRMAYELIAMMWFHMDEDMRKTMRQQVKNYEWLKKNQENEREWQQRKQLGPFLKSIHKL